MINHSIRVANLVNRLTTLINLSKETKQDISISSIYHDIGKTKIDYKILNKPTKLSDYEFNQIKKHSNYGYNIGKQIGLNNNILNNILYHHENYNGTGYPKGLKQENIPLGARIIRICDVYDALTSKRAYRDAVVPIIALEIMKSEKENFDPYLYKAFLKIIKEGD